MAGVKASAAEEAKEKAAAPAAAEKPAPAPAAADKAAAPAPAAAPAAAAEKPPTAEGAADNAAVQAKAKELGIVFKDGRYRDKDGHPSPAVSKDYKVDWATWQGFRRCDGPMLLLRPRRFQSCP